ncbi:putative metallopeptidase [Phaeomoniella chlamydospora]|uniref:Putative metallopeptidase n=1 Tax=Phaeomoniella chlamydospora TaxID=158046 RepID=A0A0G2EYN4_PHACM|nr:putative metallopeptidase [Phaeomoniella chlamydospora]
MGAFVKDRVPPQPSWPFNPTPESLIEQTKAAIRRNREALDAVCSTVAPAEATFDNALRPMAFSQSELMANSQYIVFFRDTSPDPKLRAASGEASNLIKTAWIENNMREDVFRLLESVVKKNPDLDAESRRYLDKMYQETLKNGLNLDESKRDEVKELDTRIQTLVREFVENLTENNEGLWLNEEELDGLPDSVMDNLEHSEDATKVRFTFKRPYITSALSHVISGVTRKKLYIASQNFANNNQHIFKECLRLRDKLARVLGHENFVEFIFQLRIAESRESVEILLDDLQNKMREPAVKHLQQLKELKRTDLVSKNRLNVEDEGFYHWDTSYYDLKLREELYHVNQENVAEYFPADYAIRGMLDAFENMFGILIHEVTSHPSMTPLWHPDVKAFTVWDNDNLGGSFLGYLYTDIYPREGKYGHNAMFEISPGYTDSNGQRHYPSAALVCNLNKPTPTRPSLLTHRQVLTLFHELGHAMFDLLARTNHAFLHALQVARDFGEMPSKMLEYFCWDPNILQTMSKHYSYICPEYRRTWLEENPNANAVLPPEKIPTEMVENIVRARHVGVALEQLRQISFSKFDLTIYGQKTHDDLLALDPSVVWNRIRAETDPVLGPSALGMNHDWGNGHLVTSHFIWGNAACYYGYQL